MDFQIGDVVKGSFHSCTGAGAVLKIGRRHVEIPLTRLDEEDAALAASLTGAEARRNLKLAAMLWPFLMKELQKVTWTPAEKNISPRYHEMARKKNAGALTGTRKVDGLVCATSLSIIQGPPFRIREYFRPQARPESGRGQKNFDVVLEQGAAALIMIWIRVFLFPPNACLRNGRKCALPFPLCSLRQNSLPRENQKLQECGLLPACGKPPRQGSL
ncbi:hypothetical protein M5E88_07165 [Akkermansia muciniphila]|nr:hypothetical protein M5E88_07165 [Akkermansia muciniphila]